MPVASKNTNSGAMPNNRVASALVGIEMLAALVVEPELVVVLGVGLTLLFGVPVPV